MIGRLSVVMLAWGVVAVLMMSVAGPTLGVNIDMVQVGNPGNDNDVHGRGYGRVPYEYDIGKYEVTAGQYTEFLNAVAAEDTYGLYNTSMWSDHRGCKIQRSGGPGNYTYSVAADWADRPVNFVSWGDSARFCNWLANGQPTGAQGLTNTEDGSYYLDGATSDGALMAVSRKACAVCVIPKESEWYKAAYYDGSNDVYYDYPTGTDATPSNALIDPDPGNNANLYDPNVGGEVGYTIGAPYYRTEVGEFDNSGSPYGTFDQGGNLWEWTEGIVSGSQRGLRGGSHGNCASVENLLASDGRSGSPVAETFGIGFRVAAAPEPGTVGLLMIGGAAQEVSPEDLEALLRSQVTEWRWRLGEVPGAEASAFDDSAWERVAVGHRWWPSESTCWYRTRIRIPERINGVPVAGSTVRLKVGIDNEAKAYVDGELRQQFTWDDGDFVLRKNAQPGDVVVVALHAINRPGFGSLYKADLVSSAGERMVDALRECLGAREFALAGLDDLDKEGAAHWMELAGRAAKMVDLRAYKTGDVAAFVKSVDKARSTLLADAGTVEASLAETARMLAKLKDRIRRAEAAGKPAAYRTLDARVTESWLRYARDDLAEEGILRKLRGLRAADYIRCLCRRALADPTDRLVPRYRTGRPTIRDGAFWQDHRPVFFTGVGHFSQVRKDVPILTDYGLNIIQIEMGPANGLPDPDTVDIDAIRKNVVAVLDNAARHHVAVNLLISPHYFPKWAVERNPALADCGHGFLHNCIDAPDARTVYEKWLRGLMPLIAKHAALHSICLSNEPQYRCRCAHALAGFHRWLRARHGDTKTMNARYGTTFARFEDVPIPEDTANYPLFFDACRFNQDRLRAFHEFERGIIHEHDPDLPVHAKVMSLAFEDPGRFRDGVNHEDFNRLGAIAGNDCVQTFAGRERHEYAQNWLVMAMNYTLQRCTGREAPIFNSEDHIITDGDVQYIPGSHIRTAFWTQALYGQGAATTWVWSRGQSGDAAENILTRANCVHAMGRVGLDLCRLASEMHALQRVKAEAAILYSHSSLLPSQHHTDECKAVFEGATFTDAVWDFVTERLVAAGGLNAYKLVVIPRAANAPDAVVAGFNAAIARGVTVMTVGECFTRDEYGRERAGGLKQAGRGRLVAYPNPMTPRAYREILDGLLTKAGVARPVQLTGVHKEPVWGVDLRAVRRGEGLLVNLANFTREPRRVVLRSRASLTDGTNLFTGEAVRLPLTLQPLDPVLLRFRARDR